MLQNANARFIKRDCSTPLDVDLKVYEGHIANIESINTLSPKVLAEEVIHRTYQSENVEKIVLENEVVKGYLFLPKGSKKYPGITNINFAS